VVGHLKTVGIVAGGVFIFGDTMTSKKFAGVALSMAGIIWWVPGEAWRDQSGSVIALVLLHGAGRGGRVQHMGAAPLPVVV